MCKGREHASAGREGGAAFSSCLDSLRNGNLRGENAPALSNLQMAIPESLMDTLVGDHLAQQAVLMTAIRSNTNDSGFYFDMCSPFLCAGQLGGGDHTALQRR